MYFMRLIENFDCGVILNGGRFCFLNASLFCSYHMLRCEFLVLSRVLIFLISFSFSCCTIIYCVGLTMDVGAALIVIYFFEFILKGSNNSFFLFLILGRAYLCVSSSRIKWI